MSIEIPEKPRSRRRLRFPRMKTLVVLLLFIVTVGAAVYFYLQWQDAREEAWTAEFDGGDPAATPQIQANEVIEMVGKTVLLPQGETPALIRVTDKNSLTQNKEFFKDAENGDVVLVYNQARKAFLFRPSTQKLINIAPVNISPEADSEVVDNEAAGRSEIGESPTPVVSSEPVGG